MIFPQKHSILQKTRGATSMPRLYRATNMFSPYRMLIPSTHNKQFSVHGLSVIPNPRCPRYPHVYIVDAKTHAMHFFNRNFLRILSMCRWQILSLYSALREFYILLYQTLCIYLYLNKSMASSSSSSPLSSSCTSAHLSRNDHRATTPSFRIQLILETVSRFT